MSFGDFSSAARSTAQHPWKEVTQTLFALSANTSRLERLVNQLGTRDDTPAMRQTLHNLLESTRSLVKTATDAVRPVLTADTKNDVQLHLVQTKIQKDFEDLLNKFQAVSKLSARRTKEFLPKTLPPNKLPLHDEDEEFEEDKDSVPLLSTSKIAQQRQFANDVEFQSAIIQERDEELRHIEQSIVEVNEIFRDLGNLVHEQQYMLDNIESNVENAATSLENASNELSRANEYQKRRRRRMFWIVMCVAILVLFILLFIIV